MLSKNLILLPVLGMILASCAPGSRLQSGHITATDTSGQLQSCGDPATASIFLAHAQGSDWSKAANLVAFHRKSSDGAWHLYTIARDGTGMRQLGVGSPTFPQRTTGSPAWSPDGKYIAFVAEKSQHPGGALGSFAATPGWGAYSDLWITTADGTQAWQLTDLPVGNWQTSNRLGENYGTLLPQFSPNGQLLEWTEFEGRNTVIKVAHFSVSGSGTPAISDVQTVDPGGSANTEFIETGGFSPDSSTMLFTSDFQTHHASSDQIYALTLSSGAITRLTQGNTYNEHPRYTPTGQIIWMTDKEQPLSHLTGDDWWIMNSNGSDPHRLTSFNNPVSPNFFGQTVYATVVDTESWATNGSFFLGDVETGLISSDGDIVKVNLTCH